MTKISGGGVNIKVTIILLGCFSCRKKEGVLMNRVYKVIWNKGKNCYSVVSEIAKTHGKSSGYRKKAVTAVMVLSLLSAGGLTYAEDPATPAPEPDNGRHYFSYGSNDSANPKGSNWNNDGAKGASAIAVGQYAGAKGDYGTAVGSFAQAGGTAATATGSSAKAMGEFSTATGSNAVANGQISAAFGSGAKATGTAATAAGSNAVANEKTSSAFGSAAKATGVGATALGVWAQAKSNESVAVGAYTVAEKHAAAIGPQAKALDEQAVAVGDKAEAQAAFSLAVGAQASATQKGGVALGGGSLADRQAGVWGFDASAGKAMNEDTLLGEKKAERAQEIDKLNGLRGELQQLRTQFEESRKKDPIGKPSDKTKQIEENLKNKTNEFNAQFKLVNGYVNAWQSIDGAVSVGNAEVGVTRQITGVAAGTEDTDVVNVAQLKAAVKDVNTEAAKHTTVAAGQNITVDEETNDNGGKAYTVKLNDTLTGLKSVETEEITVGDKVTINKDGLKTGDVTIKEDGIHAGDKVITGVADGEKATDAVNLRQLKSVQTEAAKHTTVAAGTNITVDEETNDNGGKAYTVKLNDTLTGLKSVETEEITVGDKVTINKDGLKTGDVTIKEDGIHAGDKVITGVADGVKATDAVNMRQLGALENQVKTNTTNISLLNGRVDMLDNRVNRVGAGAAALAGLHPLDYDPENKWDFAAGYGNYNGANAVAIGAFYRPDENKIISIGGSFGGGENMVSAGISVKVGQGTGITTSKAAMANEIRELKARDREREAQMQEIMRKLEILQKQAGK